MLNKNVCILRSQLVEEFSNSLSHKIKLRSPTLRRVKATTERDPYFLIAYLVKISITFDVTYKYILYNFQFY